GKLKENIEANKELGLLSKKLATIITDFPVEFDEEDLEMCEPNVERVKEIFMDLEFRQLLENFYRTFNLERQDVGKAKTVSQLAVQASLFGENEVTGELTSESFYKEIATYAHLYQLVEGKMGRKLLLDK